MDDNIDHVQKGIEIQKQLQQKSVFNLISELYSRTNVFYQPIKIPMDIKILGRDVEFGVDRRTKLCNPQDFELKRIVLEYKEIPWGD